jgi:DNA mismatch repair protein MutH
LDNYNIPYSELLTKYNPANNQSVLEYAKRLIGQTLRPYLSEEDIDYLTSSRGKGAFGNYLEEAYFHIKNNNESRPDIEESGVEIKSGQVVIIRNNHYRLKERLKIAMIDYHNSFDKGSLIESNLWPKLEKILLILFVCTEKNRVDQECMFADILKWNEEDINQMSSDWAFMKELVNSGRANQLSEGLTWYLGASTAGASASVSKSAPGNVEASVRAFSLKNQYLNYKLGFVAEPKGPSVAFKISSNKNLDSHIVDNLKPFIGQTLDDVAKKINRLEWTKSLAKNKNAKISRALLEEVANTRTADANSNFLQFKKSGLMERTVTLEESGKLRESISFPAFKWMELINEDVWEESGLYQAITNKFFFTVFKKTKSSEAIFLGSFFWTMPESDVREMRKIWEDTKNNIANNCYDCFAKISDGRVGHIRPHAKNKMDTAITPQGEQRMKHSFWLNSGYILKIVNQQLKL